MMATAILLSRGAVAAECTLPSDGQPCSYMYRERNWSVERQSTSREVVWLLERACLGFRV